jgi:hypothetical protein
MSEVRKKPGMAFWAAVALIVVVFYVLSIGPVAWAIRKPWFPTWLNGPVHITYWPITWIEGNGPQPIRSVLGWYGHFWY